MNRPETIDFVFAFERFQPAFAKWRDAEAGSLAAAHGTSVLVEARGMLDSLVRTLDTVTPDEASSALQAMESGSLAVPPYGSLGLVVRSYAADSRRHAATYTARDERRYKCIVCLDTGLLEVINPHFVEWFRPTFFGYKADGFPKNWRGLAYSEWRKRDPEQPMIHSAMCSCDCPRIATMKSERELFRKNDRRLKREPLGLPACGAANYVSGRMPVVTGRIFLREILDAWYAEHEPNEIYEWDADAFEYPG